MNKIKLQGLARKWTTNVLSTVFLLLIVFIIIISFVVYTYYNNTISDYVLSELDSISTSFSTYASANTKEFEAGAKEFVENFDERDRMEVQFLSNSGNVIMSTSGFPMASDQLLLDNANAKNDDQNLRIAYRGKLSNGEQVVTAHTTITSNTNSNITLGSIRLIVSLRETNKQLLYIVLLIVAAGMLMFVIILSSGLYFLRSIIRPVRNIGEITRQIASGDFDARIESKSDDEIGNLCESINNMAGELSAAERMKNEFISSVSHELRTPLTAIKGWAETVQGTYDDPQLMEKGMSVIINESERLSALVEDLLDFSRLQNGQMSFQLKPCDVVAELSEAVLTYTDAASRAGINLVYTEPASIPFIEGDESRLQQVFVNIIDNAIKYTPSGGTIDIAAKYDAGFIIIMISDTGSGIPEDELDKVKQKFFKGKRATRGSGIGLAVADEIIKKHGGLLDIASTEHVGTTVTITLPVIPEKESEAQNKE